GREGGPARLQDDRRGRRAPEARRVIRGRDLRSHGRDRPRGRSRTARARPRGAQKGGPMRLKTVEHGQALRHRLRLWMIRLVIGEFPDVMRTMWYRPRFFGYAFLTAMQAAMRGPSEWSVGERELFATFVSSLNQCPF